MKELEYPFDSNLILRKKKEFKRILLENENLRNSKVLKIAILGGSTTIEIKNVLELFLLNQGIAVEFYESEYNRFYEDGVFSNVSLNAFFPDVVVICISTHNISNWPELSDSKNEVEQKLNDEYNRFESIWNALTQRFHCSIIQTNMEIPVQRIMGCMETSDFHGRVNFVTRLNQKFYEYSQSNTNFYIHDINSLSAEFGLSRWHNQRHWDLYKCAQSIDAIPAYAYQLASIILSIRGKSKKVIILDADNTLWGGVIGDCGVEKISLGPETAKGQSFLEWQKYLKRLKNRGIILLIASKNEQKSVIAGLSHPNSVLKVDDFAAMAVDWNDKASNIKELAKHINISSDQMIFIDDNPVERALVKENVEGIVVLEANTPDEFIKALQEGHYLEAVSFSTEDAKRTEMYHENLKREDAKKQFADYDSFLRSLNMKAEIVSFEKVNYERIAQLSNKTNQFNLTGRRFSVSEVTTLADDKNWICLSGKLTDRFGDNGIVCLLFAECIENTAVIRNFLMSCRVFERGMEYAMMNFFIDECRARNIAKVEADYVPSEKNTPVKDLYKRMGFSSKNENDDRIKHWSLELDSYMPHKNYIEVN